MQIKNIKAFKKSLRMLLWDTHLDENEALNVLQNNTTSKKQQKLKQVLIIKVMNAHGWYELLEFFDIDTLKSEFLKPEIIQGVFPRPLRKKYEFISRTL